MKIKHYFSLFFTLAVSVLMFQNCQPTQELQPTKKDARTARPSVTNGGYTVALVGVSSGNTWTYTITRDGGANLDAWSLDLGPCIKKADVTVVSLLRSDDPPVDVKGQTTINVVDPPAGNSKIEITGIPALGNNQTFTLTFTLNYAVPVVSVPSSATTSTIDTEGNPQLEGTYAYDIDGPGCPQILGTVYKATCVGSETTPYANVTVTAAPGALTTVTSGTGSYTFTGISGTTTYTLSVTGTPDNVQSIIPPSQTAVSGGVANFTAITGPCNNGCSMSQGYYFAKPNTPDFSVTFGAFTYTKAEGVAIWNTSNKGGINDTKKAFLQASAIQLNLGTINPSASVINDYNIVKGYLAGLPNKVSPTYLPNGTTASKAAAAAAGRIGKWIQANHCDYSDPYPLYLPN